MTALMSGRCLGSGCSMAMTTFSASGKSRMASSFKRPCAQLLVTALSRVSRQVSPAWIQYHDAEQTCQLPCAWGNDCMH